MEAVKTIHCLVFAAVLFMAQLLRAFEPFDIQKGPEEIPAFDHLRPIDRAVPEFRYVESTGKYLVQQGPVPKQQRVLNRQHKFEKQREISAQTAQLIHELWTNVLLQTRYDRRGVSEVITNTTKCRFSTFVANLGWMHGETSYPSIHDLPPDWMCDAGETLFAFATAQHGEAELRDRFAIDFTNT